MKKVILGIIALSTLNAMAVELQIKGGYDFFRFQSKEKTFYEKGKNLKEGFVVNAELFPFNHIPVEPGIGIEYNFTNDQAGIAGKEEQTENSLINYHYIPVYGIVKGNLITTEKGDSPLAVVGKLGYAFVQRTDNKGTPGAGGIYYGLGVNGEYGPFVVEFLASRTHLLSKDSKTINSKGNGKSGGNGEIKDKGDITKVGITAGFRIGKLEKPIEVVEEEPVEVIEPIIVEIPEEPVIVEEVKEPVKEEPVVEVVEKEEVKVEPTIEKLEIQTEALFNFDKFDLENMLQEGKEKLEELAKLLKEDYVKVQAIQVVGHTDRLGSEKYNMALGQKRANTVKKYLMSLGVNVDIVATSKGESEPKVTCKGKKVTKELKDCLLENRRVEINVVGQKYIK